MIFLPKGSPSCVGSGLGEAQRRLISPTEDAAQEAKNSRLRKWQSRHRRACTNACTSETQKLLEVLAATLRSLSDEDRARLAELIQRED